MQLFMIIPTNVQISIYSPYIYIYIEIIIVEIETRCLLRVYSALM